MLTLVQVYTASHKLYLTHWSFSPTKKNNRLEKQRIIQSQKQLCWIPYQFMTSPLMLMIGLLVFYYQEALIIQIYRQIRIVTSLDRSMGYRKSSKNQNYFINASLFETPPSNKRPRPPPPPSLKGAFNRNISKEPWIL